MTVNRHSGYVGIAVLALLSAGCDLPGVTPPPTPTAEATNTPLPTQVVATPTLLPTPTNIVPTALPPPTEIPVPTAAPAGTDTASGLPAGPSMSINPAVGEPGEVTIVTGTGFAAGELVSFHWNAADNKAPTGPVIYEMNADGNGMFTVGLKIPPADKWPGGPPVDRSLIQLRVTAPSLGFNWLYANFTYVKRFNPQPVAPTATPEPPTATPTP